MKFLIISEGGDGIGLATRLKAEGNDVRMWIRDTEVEHRGEGFVEKAKDSVWGEIVVADCTGAGALLDHMRGDGSRVVGGSAIADKLESDRRFATEVMVRHGIQTPQSKHFDSWDDAIEFVKGVENSVRFVFKPEGSLSGIVPSQVTKNNQELVENIEHFKTLVGSDKPEFTLQEFIEGTAISTEGWFDGDKWLLPFNHTIERKQLMVGDIGPSGGCTGNVVWPCGDDDWIVREGLFKIEEFLREVQYKGAIDLNSVVNEEGVFGLEFTPRFGYDAFPTFLFSLYSGDFGGLLYELARGDADELMRVRDGFGAGVRLSIPPWPCEKYHAEEGVPLRGLHREDLSSFFYPYDVKERDGKFVTSGGYGIVGVCNGYGDSIGHAFAQAYQRLSKIKVFDGQYRTDLADVCFDDYRNINMLHRRDTGWIGVDLDGTLARYSRYSKYPGEPIPKMVNRVRRWVNDGREVRIVTARVAPLHKDRVEQLNVVHEWVLQHIGHPLEVIPYKDPLMQWLYDDRVKQVEQDTGVLVAN